MIILEMVMVCKGKIGIDFHGVLNTNPTFFKDFIALALMQNIEVHIISGGPEETIIRYLQEHGIPYSVLWCIYDHYEKNNKVTYYADGSFHIDDRDWNLAKAEYCLEQKICLHIDDSTIYQKKFSTPYCLYDEKSKTCQIGNEIIDFSSHPEQALTSILAYCLY